MKKVSLIILVISFVFHCCTKVDSPYHYPESKIWAHKVNDTAMAKDKSRKFVGLEVDAIYSEYQDKIFVGHNIEDTANNLTLEIWFNYVETPAQKHFWIDLKNLDRNNAKTIAKKIVGIMNQHNMSDNVFVESTDIKALKKIKDSGIRVIFWTENLIWNNLDTASWIEHTKKHIEELKPDAISEESGMFELITGCFPEQNIHLWQTPTNTNGTDTATLKELCGNKSVKVILIDNEEPIKY